MKTDTRNVSDNTVANITLTVREASTIITSLTPHIDTDLILKLAGLFTPEQRAEAAKEQRAEYDQFQQDFADGVIRAGDLT